MNIRKIKLYIDELNSISKDGARCSKKCYDVSRTRYGTSCSGIKRFGTTTETFSNTISIPLAIAGRGRDT